jgi:hypothetical protein
VMPASKDIPTLREATRRTGRWDIEPYFLSDHRLNPDFYRELANFIFMHKLYQKVRLVLK